MNLKYVQKVGIKVGTKSFAQKFGTSFEIGANLLYKVGHNKICAPLGRKVGYKGGGTLNKKCGTLVKSVVHLLYKSVVHQNMYHSVVQKCGTFTS